MSAVAAATPVTWTLNNGAFDDGQTAVGSFNSDVDTGVYSDINITTGILKGFGPIHTTQVELATGPSLVDDKAKIWRIFRGYERILPAMPL